ncbi:MAG: hypothetical protein ACRDIB_18510, partial [Ardenticatenaceae bacterium]
RRVSFQLAYARARSSRYDLDHGGLDREWQASNPGARWLPSSFARTTLRHIGDNSRAILKPQLPCYNRLSYET